MSARLASVVAVEKLRAFRALRHRNFKLFFYGQMMSMAGTWMQRVAQGWLAYRLTGSAQLLGAVTFASSAPAFFLSPFAGVVADRTDRHRMLVAAQVVLMVQAFLLAWVTLAGSITPNRLIAFAWLLGLGNAFENPVRQSFFMEMVSREDLMNAIALNPTMVNVARIAGPAVAGVVVARYGEGMCFLINALSFLAVIVALLMMRLTKQVEQAAARSGLTLLPLFAGTVLNVGAEGLGWLMTASGVGAMICATALAFKSSERGLYGGAMLAAVLFAAAIIILGRSRHFSLSLVMMLLIGAGYVISLAATQTLLQTWVTDELRGRVMSLYSTIFVGLPPFGSLFAGWVADRIGAPLTVSVGGVICLLAALGFAWPGGSIQKRRI